MERVRGFLRVGFQVERYVLSGLLIVLTLIVFLGVFTRYVLGFSFHWIEEIPRYCLVWVTFLGASALMRGGINHPRVIMLVSALPRSLQKYILVGENIIMMVVLGVMATGAILMMSINSRQLSPAVEMPMYIIYVVIPLSAFISVIRLTLDTWRLLRAGGEGFTVTPDKYL